LISDDERKSSSRVPGLGDIPLLGRLFSNQEDKKIKTEIVLAITPRIISNIDRPSAEISEYWSGTETVINDKPQLNLPAASSPPMNALERAKENMRLRQQQAPETPPEQPAAPEPTPVEQAPERPAAVPLDDVRPESLPVIVDPTSPPAAP
jgi:general secretion pathway protein D